MAPERPCPAPPAPAKWRCLGVVRPGSATKASAPAAATTLQEAEKKRPAARPAAQAGAPAATPHKAEKKSPETEQRPLLVSAAKWHRQLGCLPWIAER